MAVVTPVAWRANPIAFEPDIADHAETPARPVDLEEVTPTFGAAIARRALALADMFAVAVTLFCVFAIGTDNALLAPSILALPAIVIAAKLGGLYDRDEVLLRRSTLDEVPRLFYLATLGTLVFAVLQGSLVEAMYGSGEMVIGWGLLFVCLTAFRSLARTLTAIFARPEACLVVGDAESTALLRYKLETTVGVKADVVSHVRLEDGHGLNNGRAVAVLEQVDEALAVREVDRVILAPGRVSVDDTLGLITQLKQRGLKVSLLPPMSQVFGSSVEVDRIDDLTLLGVRRFVMSRSSRMVKRTFDLAGSSVAILLLAPVFLVTALAIKSTSRGPVFFRQIRIGRNGNTFEIYKFRSMVTDAEDRKNDLRHLNEATDGLFKIQNDPRITTVGNVIRRWHIDELPQFLNVLFGHMSLVGPRPLVPEEDRLIQGWHRHRLNVAPGVTGHWQVMGSARVPLREMVTIDYAYVANWSLWNDITLLARTIPHVLRQRGM